MISMVSPTEERTVNAATKKYATLIIIVLPFAMLIFVGVRLLDSSCRPTSASEWYRVADTSSLGDGSPLHLKVRAESCDAWTRHPDRILGEVFVLRNPQDDGLIAFRADHHPTLRIPVVYDASTRRFRSKCWRVEFGLDGKETMVGDRPLINAELERVPISLVGTDVWVQYKNTPDGRTASGP
jgi:hypothetical protein